MMLDFAKPKLPECQLRCQRRAGVARSVARLLVIVLAGLIGTALVAEPAMVSGIRGGMSSLLSDSDGATRTVTARTAPFASAVPIRQSALAGLPNPIATALRTD